MPLLTVELRGDDDTAMDLADFAVLGTFYLPAAYAWRLESLEFRCRTDNEEVNDFDVELELRAAAPGADDQPAVVSRFPLTLVQHRAFPALGGTSSGYSGSVHLGGQPLQRFTPTTYETPSGDVVSAYALELWGRDVDSGYEILLEAADPDTTVEAGDTSAMVRLTVSK